MTINPTVPAPISDREFANRLWTLGYPGDAVPVVACSGGPDSIALTALADAWANARGRRARAVVVDHGLRPEAGDEAEAVAAVLNGVGVTTAVLHYDGPKPEHDVQAAARAIRYRLIGAWMQAQGFGDLLLAQHRDDQAETLLLRLARGSGIDGLAAMAPVSQRGGMTLWRPLLDFPKERLEATAAASGLSVVRDPSNLNREFARVRMRQLRPTLAAEGLTAKRLADTARRMARARNAFDVLRDRFLAAHMTADPTGFCVIDPTAFLALPEELRLRVLSHVVRVIGGRDHPPREVYLQGLHDAVAGGRLRGGRTLAGARVLSRRGVVIVAREAARMADPEPVRPFILWDGRYECRFDVAAADYAVGALGPAGVTIAKAEARAALAALPSAVRPTLPALWRGDSLAAVPHLGLHRDDDAPEGRIGFSLVPDAWGSDFRRRLPFSNGVRRPM